MARPLGAALLLLLAACRAEKPASADDTADDDTAADDTADDDTADDTDDDDTADDDTAADAPPFPDLGCTLTQPWPIASAEDVTPHYDHIVGIFTDLVTFRRAALDAAEARGCPAPEGVLDEHDFDLRGPCAAEDTSFDGRFTGVVLDGGSTYTWEGVTMASADTQGTWEADGTWDSVYGEGEEHTFDLDLTVPSTYGGGPIGHLVYRSAVRLHSEGFEAGGYVALDDVASGSTTYTDGDFCYLDDVVSTAEGVVGSVAVKGSAEAIAVFDGTSDCAPLWLDGVVTGELCAP